MTTPARHRRTPQRPVRALFAALAAGVTAVAVLGGLGVMPSSASLHDATGLDEGTPAALERASYDDPGSDATDDASTDDTGDPPPASGSPGVDVRAAQTDSGGAVSDESGTEADPAAALPADSGQGRRVVFSESRQRVWLVSGRQRVKRTYLVSGSIYDNLDVGSYEVYSRSKDAWGIDDSGTMHYFVRFAQGDRAAIGFHDIPVADGRLVQTAAQLGTPQSHGCIRQLRADAKVLWRFAPLGTTVVVTA